MIMNDFCSPAEGGGGGGGVLPGFMFMHSPFSWREKVVITLRAVLHYTTLLSMIRFMASIWAMSLKHHLGYVFKTASGLCP